MKRHVLILGVMVAFSSFLLGQTTSQDFQSTTSNSKVSTSDPGIPAGSLAGLQLAMASGQQGQEAGKQPSNTPVTKQDKKARKQQEKADKKRRKKEAQERQKQLKKEQQQAAAQRKKELKEENKQIANERKKQQKEEQKEQTAEAKKRTGQERREQAAGVPVPQRPEDRDHERQNATGTPAQNVPPPAAPAVSDQDHERQNATGTPAQNVPSPAAPAVSDQDRDRQNVTGSQAQNAPPPPPPAASDQDHDRDQMARKQDEDRQREAIARDRDRDREREEMARDRDRDRQGEEVARNRDHDRDRDFDRDRERERFEPGRMRPGTEPIPVVSNPAPGALAAQRSVSQAILSQMPNSNVLVLVNNNNQIVLTGSAPTPSFRHRLLQLAGAAAGGYSIVDQLAANAVSSAAGSAASAAVGGIGDLFHGSGSNYSTSAPAVPAYAPASGNSGSPSNPSISGLEPGSNGCANVYNNNQVLLTGQAASQADADRMRQLAQQLGGSNATVVNQLATIVNGTNSPSSTTVGSAGSASAGSTSAASAAASPLSGAPSYGSMVSPGSVVCVNVDNNNQVLLTGTVASPAEIGAVEQSLQPVLGNQRLIDNLSAGAISAASRPSGTGGTSGTLAGTGTASGSATAGPNTAVASPSQPPGAGASAGRAKPATQVEQALHSVPRLSNVDADVTASAVRLSGSVGTNNDDQMAREIVRQYAPGRDVVDNLTVNRAGARDTSRDNTSR